MTPALRVLVTGSRKWCEPEVIHAVLMDCWHDAVQLGARGLIVVHGTAGGADSMADAWARARSQDGVRAEPVPADWATCGDECQPAHRRARRDGATYCPTAGHRRNQQMVDRGAAVTVGLWRPPGTGTLDCLKRAERAGIPTRRIEATL